MIDETFDKLEVQSNLDLLEQLLSMVENLDLSGWSSKGMDTYQNICAIVADRRENLSVIESVDVDTRRIKVKFKGPIELERNTIELDSLTLKFDYAEDQQGACQKGIVLDNFFMPIFTQAIK
jgi:c-di-GMP-related signal transduction protein